MGVSRAQVLEVIREVHQRMSADGRGDEGVAFEVLAAVCRARGLDAEACREAIEGDAELGTLFRAGFQGALLTAPDPGPYDAISRESPRGAPDPLPEAFERDEQLLRGREYR